tara:strand:+ start:543 stop:950 length:408 start_codon:yes stop_codon:yes gene_type:complete
MKKKLFTSMGLMSGTSMDGIDISIIQSDGYKEFYNISDEYFEYDSDLQQELINLRNLVLNENELLKYSLELGNLERKITIFHADKINYILSKVENEIDLIGFHGQTIFHKPQKKNIKTARRWKIIISIIKKKSNL